MHIALVANGELPFVGRPALTTLLHSVDLVIAVDGGLDHCVVLDRWPDRLIGDLDSASASLIDRARNHETVIVEYPQNKDATDLELALADAVALGADEITVVAPFGGRLDHELATTNLLVDSRWVDVVVTATDGRRTLWVIRSQCNFALEPASTLTLLAWGDDVHGVTTSGLQWPLEDEVLMCGSTRGVSNVVINPTQQVSVTSGTLVAITDADEDSGDPAER